MSDYLLEGLLKSSLSSSTKNLAWYNDVSVLARKKSISVLEVGVGGGSLAVAALAIKRNQSPSLMAGTKIIGFDLFKQIESFSKEDMSPTIIKKFENELNLRSRVETHKDFYTPTAATSLILSSQFTGSLTIVDGDFCETFPQFLKENDWMVGIDILRVSCNWYKPVKFALETLMPFKPSIIYLDGYYHWEGFRKGVQESNHAYIAEVGYKIEDCHVFKSPEVNSLN